MSVILRAACIAAFIVWTPPTSLYGQTSDTITEQTPFSVYADHADGTYVDPQGNTQTIPVTGFRLYRNGALIDAAPLSARVNGLITFDQPFGWSAGQYTVIVSAYNGDGESLSAPLTLTVTTPPSTVACNDTVDNDGDGLIDLADPGCDSASDTDEFNEAPPPVESTPFTGTPISLPGTIQAEDFDHGGEGVAYHDTTTSNEGGAYRSTDVDIALAGDIDGGYTIGWAVFGEWLQYTVNAMTAGSYTLSARVASAVTGGTFRVESNGNDVTGPIQVPNTGGWFNWVTITRDGVPLPAGEQKLRFVVLSESAGSGNVNWLQFTLTPPPPPPPTLTAVCKGGQRKVTVTDTPPDATGGWSVQFRFNNSNGTFTNIGAVDTSSPFTRTSGSQAPGTYSVSAVWMKAGVSNIIHGPVTVICD